MEKEEVKKDETVVTEETKEQPETTPELPSEKPAESEAPTEDESAMVSAPVEEPTTEEVPVSEEKDNEAAPAEPTVPVEPATPEETAVPEQTAATEQAAEQTQTIDASNQPIAMMASESVAEQKAQQTVPQQDMPAEEAPQQVKTYSEEEKKQSRQNSFNSDERLLYEIKPDKQGNPLIVAVFFVMLFAFIFLLPNISKKYEDFFGKTFTKQNTPTTPSQPTQPDESQKTEFYKLNGGNFRVAIGDLEMINFVKSEKNGEYFLSFTIQNIADKVYQYSKKYYVTMYKDEQLLYRALLHTYEPLPAKGADEISLIISEKAYKDGNQFKIEEINPSQYPTAQINEKSGEYQVLKCIYRYDEMKYYFSDNKLAKIEEKYLQESNTPNYAANKTEIETISSKLKAIEGIDSTFIERDTEFEMVNSFELKNVSDSNLASIQLYRFFKYNESKDVIKFEIEAQGYKCS